MWYVIRRNSYDEVAYLIISVGYATLADAENEIQTWYNKHQHASYQYAILFLYK